QAALEARTFAISADHKVRVGCGALDIAGTRRTSACRRSDCTVAETGRKRRSKQPGKARLACAHGPATARHFQDWARSSTQPPTDRAWERGAPARSLYLVRNDSCGNWRGNRCSQGRAVCAPSTENFSGSSANEGSKLTPARGHERSKNAIPGVVNLDHVAGCEAF